MINPFKELSQRKKKVGDALTQFGAGLRKKYEENQKTLYGKTVNPLEGIETFKKKYKGFKPMNDKGITGK